MSCAMGRVPEVTYRTDTPFATSGCFSNSLRSALSRPSLASWALSRCLLGVTLLSLIRLDQQSDSAEEKLITHSDR
jgi:hypothetical protein